MCAKARSQPYKPAPTSSDSRRQAPKSYYQTGVSTPEYPVLQGSQQTDVCIIGGGYTGLSAALHLAEKGYQVLLLEAETPGWGASGRNGGQVCPGHNREHQQLARELGRPLADQLWQASRDAVALVQTLIQQHNIPCDLKQGVLHVAAKPGHNKSIEQSVHYHRTRLGYQELEYLNPQQVSERLGTQAFGAGQLWHEGLHLQPLKYALGLANAAQQAGARLYQHSRVLDYRTLSADRVQIRTQNGEVSARYLLVACNGYLERLEPRAAKRIMPINNFIIATEPLSAQLCRQINRDDLAVADSRFVVNYFKLSADNRLLWGGGESYRRRFPRDIAALVQRNMLACYPQLADTRIDYAWGGTLAITLNRMPHFARLDANTFIAQGYSGHGVALATLAGKLMADAVSGSAEGFDAFARVPSPAFPGGTLLRKPGLIAGMLFYALRDRFF